MEHPGARIVADGPQRLRAAGEHARERQRIEAQLTKQQEREYWRASVWRRLWLRLKLYRAVRAELKEKFPPAALYFARDVVPGTRAHRLPPTRARAMPTASGLVAGVLLPLILLAAVGGNLRAASPSAAPQTIRVAAISLVPTKLDLAGNADRLEAAFRRAAAGGAKIAVAPEGALDGYVINEVLATEIPVERLGDVAIAIDHPVMKRFQALARELHLNMVFGLAERIGGEIFNTAVFIDGDGVLRGKYHKMQFAEGYDSAWWFNRLGTKSRAFDTPFGRCGILICNDRWNPVLARIPALDGAQFLIIPAYGSNSRSQDEAVLSRARETGLPIIEANVGVSLIVSQGEVAALKREKEAVTFADITIPGPIAQQPAARDELEREFLDWRTAEMRRRFDAKNHRMGRAAPTSTAH